MSKVKLLNVSDSVMVFPLPHESYCRASGTCGCKWNEMHLRPSTLGPRGSGGGRVLSTARVIKKVRTPDSITLIPGKRSRPLHASVLGLPGIKTALRAPLKHLRYEQHHDGGS